MKFSTVLITGGTGSLAQAILPKLVARGVEKVIVYSRNEFNQVEMERKFPKSVYPVRYMLGDVRDRDRLYRALDDVNAVIHCAAVKHVDKCEYDPFEAVQTNVNGAQNVIDAAIDRKVQRVLAISSDKAVNPCNLYGASKLASDHMFLAGNAYSPKTTKFSVIRFGNFWGSSGSVVPLFIDLAKKQTGYIPITDKKMTRFFITLDEAAERVILALETMSGGEIFTPKMISRRIVDVGKEIYPEAEIRIIGIRPGEKMHEELISSVYASRTFEKDGGYITFPDGRKGYGKSVPDNFAYTSEEALG